MLRTLPLLLLTAVPGLAQPPAVPVKTLTVTPAAEPRPALRYELLPSYRDREPGNAALAYFRAFANRPPSQPGDDARLAKWQETPLTQLPLAEVKDHLRNHSVMFREVERASLADQCDWQMRQRIQAEGIGVLLTEIQPSREVAQYLALRARVELAEDRYADAARTIRTGLQMARDVGEVPALIHLLVGYALQAIMLERVDEWIARPNSPNLYWALSSLPRPLIDARVAFEGEALFTDVMFPGLRELERGPLPADRAQQIAEDLLKRGRGLTKDPDNPQPALEQLLARLGLAGYVALHQAQAKKELLARGRPARDVEAMPPTQVVFLNSLERFRELRDEQWKWIGMPYQQAYPALRKVEERRKKALTDDRTDVVFHLFALVLPATEKVMLAGARADRKVAALRVIEAIRLHAAAHGGQPPARLEDVTAVPVPLDPMTGKPFVYSVKGNVVTLSAPPPPGEPPNPSNSLGYEITVAKK